MPYLLKRVINVQRVTCVTNDLELLTIFFLLTTFFLRKEWLASNERASNEKEDRVFGRKALRNTWMGERR